MRNFIILNSVFAILLSVVVYFSKSFAPNFDIDIWPLIIAIVVYAIMSIVSFTTIVKSFDNPNPNVLIRSKMAVTIAKFFIGIGLVLTYIFVKHRINVKPTVYTFLAIYVIFSLMEAVALSRKATTTSVSK